MLVVYYTKEYQLNIQLNSACTEKYFKIPVSQLMYMNCSECVAVQNRLKTQHIYQYIYIIQDIWMFWSEFCRNLLSISCQTSLTLQTFRVLKSAQTEVLIEQLCFNGNTIHLEYLALLTTGITIL